ncbi:MAG: hypothetical protein R3Y61_03770 [Rikenellaceae bacterium]
MNNCVKPISKIRTGLTLQLVIQVFSLFAGVGILLTYILSRASLYDLDSGIMPDDLAALLEDMFSNESVVLMITISVAVWLVVALISFVKYYGGLKQLGRNIDHTGRKAVGYIALGQLLSLIAVVVFIIFFAAAGVMSEMVLLSVFIIVIIVMGILGLAAFILNLVGYFSIKNSKSLNEEGKAGAKRLSTAMILYLINTVAGIIPVIGPLAVVVLTILYWVFLLSGWAKIKHSFMTPTPPPCSVVPPVPPTPPTL